MLFEAQVLQDSLRYEDVNLRGESLSRVEFH
jgi:hypothetical protein